MVHTLPARKDFLPREGDIEPGTSLEARELEQKHHLEGLPWDNQCCPKALGSYLPTCTGCWKITVPELWSETGLVHYWTEVINQKQAPQGREAPHTHELLGPLV